MQIYKWQVKLLSLVVLASLLLSSVPVAIADESGDATVDDSDVTGEAADSDDSVDSSDADSDDDSDGEDDSDDSSDDSDADDDSDIDEDDSDDSSDDDSDEVEHARADKVMVAWGDVLNQIDPVDEYAAWDITITSDGKVALKEKLRFERNDKVTSRFGEVVVASQIASGVDGVIVALDEDATELEVTVNDDVYTYQLADLALDDEVVEFDDGYGLKVVMLDRGELPKVERKELKVELRNRSNNRKKRVRALLNLVDNSGLVGDCREFLEEMTDYDLVSDDQTQFSFDQLVGEVEKLSEEDGENLIRKCRALKLRYSELKVESRKAKYRLGYIRYNDIPESEWYFDFAEKVAELGFAEGYKNKDGSLTGEYRGYNNVSVAELLKMVAILAKVEVDDQADGEQWYERYVRAAKKYNLTITRDESLDLTRPATRGEVVRVVLEFLGVVDPDGVEAAAAECEYSDLSESHPDYQPICILTVYGVVNGNGDGTFKPNSPVTRAEIAKILVNARAVFGGDLSVDLVDDEDSVDDAA